MRSRPAASGGVVGTGGAPAAAPATPDPALALLRGGAVPALVVGAVLAVGLAFAGPSAAVGAVVGTVVTCLAMSAGPLVMRGTRRWSPPAVMAVSLLTYGVVVAVLGVVYLALSRVAWVSAGHLGVALIVCGAVWTAGELRAAARLRVLAFGGSADAADGPFPTGDGGSGVAGQDGAVGSELPKPH